MLKLLQKYKEWEAETLERIRSAKDLRALREMYYALGDRWEWDQVTGEWLQKAEPLDAIAFILKVPSLKPKRIRFILYVVMAYSKGFTDQFDHLGDKERVIIEKDTETGELFVWSTTGHGALDISPLRLNDFRVIEEIFRQGYLVAQPGDHALRLRIVGEQSFVQEFFQLLWDIASGNTEFTWRKINLFEYDDIERFLEFDFYRYVKAVIELEQEWLKWLKPRTGVSTPQKNKMTAKETSDTTRDKQTLREIEGLLYILWFRPPAQQLGTVKHLLDELCSKENPTGIEKDFVPLLHELKESLTSILERTKFLKWKCVADRKAFSELPIFKDHSISGIVQEALVVALDDMLKEHTLAYIAFPERATISGKVMRILLGLLVLPFRLWTSFFTCLKAGFRKVTIGRKKKEEHDKGNS